MRGQVPQRLEKSNGGSEAPEFEHQRHYAGKEMPFYYQ